LLFSLAPEALPQKVGKSGDRKPSGPKVGKAIKEEPAGPKTIVVKPNEGYLALSTTPAAKVSLVMNASKRMFQADASGQLNVPRLRPGSYRLEIKHDDCEPHAETIRIAKGDPTVLIKPLTSKFGTLMLSLGALTGPDVTIKLDGQPLAPSQFKIENEMIAVRRVPVGAHNVAIGKPGYIDWSRDRFEVKPGDAPDNLLNIDLERATIALTIRSLAGARVYVDNESKGIVATDDMLRVPGLAPGAHRLRIELFGYETADRRIALTLERREATEDVMLESIVETAEDKDDFDPALAKWFPARPSTWQVEAGRGMTVRGAAPALLKRASYPANRFNIYDDFTLVFKVKLSNGRGAAWIARARDERNYYLFELTTSRSPRGAKLFLFSICRDGVCREQSRDRVIANIEEPDDWITIKLVADGPNLEHYISLFSDPRTQMQPLGRGVSDETFRKGGVGLCAINELETYVSNFLVIPAQRQKK
jgi:hypothetical protein